MGQTKKQHRSYFCPWASCLMCCSGLCCCSSGAGTWHMNLNWGCWSKCLQTHWEALFNASFSTQGLGREASSALLLLAAQSAYHFHLYLSPVPWRVNNLCLHHFSASPTWGRFSAEDLRMEFTWSRHIGTDLHTWQLSAGIWIFPISLRSWNAQQRWAGGFLCADSQSAECSLQSLSPLVAGTYSSLDKRGFRKCLSCGLTSRDLKSKLSENSRELGISIKLLLWSVFVLPVEPWSGDKRRSPLRAWDCAREEQQHFPGTHPALRWREVKHFLP